MTKESQLFYSNLPIFKDFFDASNEDNYSPLPQDWLVAVTDIIDSTSAIKDDRYREVNILGASPIVAILNEAGQHKLPYTFGGDGCIFCVPPELKGKAETILSGCKYISNHEYNMAMRAALVPVSFIRKHGHDIKVARYAASKHYSQAIFSGGGISFAEDKIKTPIFDDFEIKSENHSSEIDFSGLECRWREVRQSAKEVITLLVKGNPSLENNSDIYKSVMREMRDIFGFDNKTNPLNPSSLSMDFSIPDLMREVKIRTAGENFLSRILYILKMEFEILIGKIFMAFSWESSKTDWSLYKPDIVQNSDSRKFDDMLRLVISGKPKQRKRFEKFLNELFEQNKLAYGMHVSDAAVITCMVFQYQRDHVHFVDGKKGGYTKASEGLKRRLKLLKSGLQ